MYCSMGNCLRAIVEIQRAEECYYRVSLGIRLVGGGCCLYSSAFSCCGMQALETAHEVKDSIGEAIICSNLGTNYEVLGNLDKALEYHRKVICNIQ